MNRNTLPPVFNPTDYTATIFESQILGETIVTVSATDPDAFFVRTHIFNILIPFIFLLQQTYKNLYRINLKQVLSACVEIVKNLPLLHLSVVIYIKLQGREDYSVGSVAQSAERRDGVLKVTGKGPVAAIFCNTIAYIYKSRIDFLFIFL